MAWEALAVNSRGAYQLAWRRLDGWLVDKEYSIDRLSDAMLAGYLSDWDTQGIAPNTLSVNLAAIKWYFSNVKGVEIASIIPICSITALSWA